MGHCATYLYLVIFFTFQTTPACPVLTPEVILEINKKVIGIVKNSEFGDVYVCILCLAQINSIVVMY